jgi:methionyl-tRNA formyltransferase
MRSVILLGKGELAIRVAQWFHESDAFDLRLIVPVVPEPAWTESLIGWAEQAGVPYLKSGSYKDIPELENPEWRPDLVFSVFYDKIVPAWFIDRCDQILNLHNGPLPRYRGVSPINWALKNGETMHGVTIHEISPGVDDGPIVGQVQYSIYPEFDEVQDVYARALEYGWTLFRETITLVDRITPAPQDDSQASYYHSGLNDQLGDRRGFTRGA